jgi:hypothetical protein
VLVLLVLVLWKRQLRLTLPQALLRLLLRTAQLLQPILLLLLLLLIQRMQPILTLPLVRSRHHLQQPRFRHRLYLLLLLPPLLIRP